MLEEAIRQGKGGEENKLKTCTAFSHSYFPSFFYSK